MPDTRSPEEIGKDLAKAALRSCGAARDFLSCVEYLDCLIVQWDGLPELARSALYKAAVIVYARPFGQQQGTDPYRVRHFRNREGFSRDIHKHVVTLRNRFIAHIDQPAYRSQLGFQVYEVREEGQETVRVPQAVMGQTFSWRGIDDQKWVVRFRDHAASAAQITAEQRDLELSGVHQFAIDHPHAYKATRTVQLEEFGPGASVATDIGPLIGHGVKPPDEDIGGPEYIYAVKSDVVAAELIYQRDGVELLSVRRTIRATGD